MENNTENKSNNSSVSLKDILLYSSMVWALIAASIIWLPYIFDMWIPDFITPEWIPKNGLAFLPSWLQWLPLPKDCSFDPVTSFGVVFSNAVLLTPAIILVGILYIIDPAYLRKNKIT